jgi:hypothetical protein
MAFSLAGRWLEFEHLSDSSLLPKLDLVIYLGFPKVILDLMHTICAASYWISGQVINSAC